MTTVQSSSQRRPLLKILLVVVSAIFLVFLSPIICRKYRVPLVANGKVIGYAKRPFVLPFKDNEYAIVVGGSNLFGLWGDQFDAPLYIYPFADGQRYLCIDDDDTAVIVFVVDFDRGRAIASNDKDWPPNGNLWVDIAQRAPRVGMDSNTPVRPPTVTEVQEVSSNLQQMSEEEFRVRSFPGGDFGFYRTYWPKNWILKTIAADRTSFWPTN